MSESATGRRPWMSALLLAGALAAHGGEPEPAHVVVLLYHHVSAETPASTSVTPETFAAHLDYLQHHDYRVVPLSRVIAALTAGGDSLPARAVAITFDDAYVSVHDTAAPLLEARGHPYAVFVSTDYVDRGFGHYLSWAQLRALEANGAEIANHSQAHDHYAHRPAGESEPAWRRRIAADIEAAQQRLEAELERPLRALAYPYGEFTPALERIAADLGFVAFGQQSGPAGPDSPPQGLPRFPMASGYAALDGFAEKLRTRPFRVTVLAGGDPVLPPGTGGAAPTLRLHLEAPGARLRALSCFVGGQGPPTLEWIDAQRGIVEITARQTLPVGRSKYTCTAPAAAGGGVFYWYSHLWMKPPAPGEWYPD